jgi:hypothetical protein
MSKENVMTDENVANVEVFDENTVYAQIIKEDDGFHVVDFDGTVGPVCKYCDADDKTIVLTKNKSNRQWFNRAKAEAEILEKGHVDLYYKASRKIGSTGSHLPNEKLISYLPEAEQAEYKAIIERAVKAKEAAKAKPMTELEKAEAKFAKAKAAYEKLLADAAE